MTEGAIQTYSSVIIADLSESNSNIYGSQITFTEAEKDMLCKSFLQLDNYNLRLTYNK